MKKWNNFIYSKTPALDALEGLEGEEGHTHGGDGPAQTNDNGMSFEIMKKAVAVDYTT